MVALRRELAEAREQQGKRISCCGQALILLPRADALVRHSDYYKARKA